MWHIYYRGCCFGIAIFSSFWSPAEVSVLSPIIGWVQSPRLFLGYDAIYVTRYLIAKSKFRNLQIHKQKARTEGNSGKAGVYKDLLQYRYNYTSTYYIVMVGFTGDRPKQHFCHTFLEMFVWLLVFLTLVWKEKQMLCFYCFSPCQWPFLVFVFFLFFHVWIYCAFHPP